MAYIKTLKDNELIGGQDNTDVYPVSTTQAIFSQKPDGTVPEGRKQLLEDRLEEDERNTEELTTRQDTVEQEMSEANRKVSSFDEKYHNITEELYSMVRSLQIGGVALSNQFGNREDIGISQKTLTKALGRIWEELGTITGKTYMDYTLTVQPTQIWAEGTGTVTVIADCSDAISDFDIIKVYVNGVLKAESSDITRYQITVEVTENSTIRVEGVIMGKTITKSQEVNKAVPFFMGGGIEYTDIMNEECRKELVGSLEGEYDAAISTTGQYLFVIIPISKKEEFRRCKMDMNGFEIPIETTEMADYIVCKSLNQYQAGTYNIDIDINS